MIQFGCCTFNFVGMELEPSLRLIRGMGFTRADIEVVSSRAQVNQLEAAAEPEKVGERLRNLAHDIGIELVEFFVVAPEIDGIEAPPNDPDDRVLHRALKQFANLCQCARISGCRSIMVVPGSPREGGEFEREWERSTASLRQMEIMATDCGLQLHVEPHSGSIATTPALALQLVHEVDGLSYVLDYAHFIGQGIPQEKVTPLLDHTGHMHGKPCGLGLGKCQVHEMTIDFKAILAELVARNWDGTISMECIWPVESANLTCHPAFQNALLAHKMEMWLTEITEQSEDMMRITS